VAGYYERGAKLFGFTGS